LRDFGVGVYAGGHHGRCDEGGELHFDGIRRLKSAGEGRRSEV
jgi:hypothetical protein